MTCVDPKNVPYKTLNNGAKMPAVGLGTFASENYTPDVVGEAVYGAVKAGYRHIDCASVYCNEGAIGAALKRLFDEGVVSREELFITSKVWNDMHSDGDVIISCAQTLKDLGVDYLDLYLIHWPFPNSHDPGCDVNSRDKNSEPFVFEHYRKVWRQMERLYKAGFVRAIGTSNMTKPKMELLLADCEIKPAVNEIELHPHFQQQELFDYLIKNGIVVTGFCPLGSPSRPERDRTPDDTSDMEDPVIVKIAADHGVHPASILIKWAVQRGQASIPFSVKESQYVSNLACVTTDPLSNEEMDAISKIDRGCRLVKGQVFLWHGVDDWRLLWDEDGTIAH